MPFACRWLLVALLLGISFSGCSEVSDRSGHGGEEDELAVGHVAGAGTDPSLPGTSSPRPASAARPGVDPQSAGTVVLPSGGLVRNVLLISLDTLRADRLQSYGYPRPTSPSLAGISSRGVVFEQARSQAPQTAPSHASLFTSSYPGVHRVINVHGEAPQLFRLPEGLTTLAELLQEASFETAAFVSGGNLTQRMGMDRGFQTWEEELTDISDRIDRCVRWMLAPERGRFFAFLHSYQVHAPYLPPQQWYEAFCDADYQGPLRERTERYLAMPAKDAWEAATGPAYWEGMLDYDASDVAFLSDLYDGEVRYVDSELRRLWEYLSGSGLLRNTAVIFLADHGEEFMDHGKYQHDQVYDELLHVPLIVRLPPELERDGYHGRVREQVELIDVAPTVAELLGVLVPPAVWSGRSLVGLMASAAETADDPALSLNRSPRPSYSELVIDPGPKYHRTVSWRGWKYIHIWQKDIDHTWEYLFHVQEDRRERRNLIQSTDAEPQRVLAALRQLLEEHSLSNAEEAARVGPGGAAEIDEDMLELMRKLGYLGTSQSSQPSRPAPAGG